MRNDMAKDCVHCGLCTAKCDFLKKYQADIGDEEKLSDLAYSCFLCGECTAVCPKGIDGRKIMLDMRINQVEKNGGKPPAKGFGAVIFEKADYIFKNYRHGKKKSVLFPGCNFPSFYPKTTKRLIDLLAEKADIGVVFDCCGKPISELGLTKKEKEITKRISAKLKEDGVEELIMVCPNCYHYLKPRLDIRVVSIYEKLSELGLGKTAEKDIKMFLPCPDRHEQVILSRIAPFAPNLSVIEGVQCCGLGGCAFITEKELSRGMCNKIISKAGGEIYTYCASCAGYIGRNGGETVHILSEILETGEKAALNGGFFNRAKAKFI